MPLFLPEKCLRNREDCEPLAQIASDDGESFVCCGANDGTINNNHQDRFRVCWKNDVVDEESEWDRRDLIDTIAVFSSALSVDENRMVNREHDNSTLERNQKAYERE